MALTDSPTARRLDHVVMPFASLAQSRDWFTRLGFTVAADAAHPFGTGNACVFFKDGLFIEPLAVVDPGAYEAAELDGNLFVRRDAHFRASLPSALSGLALKSTDAGADRESLGLIGLAEEAVTDFGRPLTLPDGTKTALSFRLIYAKDFAPHAPNLFFCEVRHSFTTDRSSLTAHPNQATGIARIEFSATDIEAAEAYLTAVLGTDGEESEDGDIVFALPNAQIVLVEVGGEDVPSFAISALTIRTAGFDGLRSILADSGVDFDLADGVLSVACPNGAGEVRFIEETGI